MMLLIFISCLSMGGSSTADAPVTNIPVGQFAALNVGRMMTR